MIFPSPGSGGETNTKALWDTALPHRPHSFNFVHIIKNWASINRLGLVLPGFVDCTFTNSVAKKPKDTVDPTAGEGGNTEGHNRGSRNNVNKDVHSA